MALRWQAIFLLAACLLPAAARAAEAAPNAAYEFALAQLLASEGDYEAAFEAFERAVAAAPRDPYVRVEHAELLFRLGRQERAAAEAAAARELAPGEPEVLRTQARIEMSRADRVGAESARIAIEDYEKLREMDPGDLEALVSLGQLYLGGGQAALAVAPLTEAARLRPGQPMIEALLARALAASGQPADAEVVQRRQLAQNPRNLPQRLELADLLARQGRHAEAAALLAEAPDGQADSLDVRRRLGFQLYLADDLDAARRQASALVEASEEGTAGRLLLGLVELAAGRFAEAESALAPLAAQAEPAEQVIELQLQALEGLGRIDEAADLLARRERELATAGRASDAREARLERALLFARAERWDDVTQLAEVLRASEDEDERTRGTLLAVDALEERGRSESALALLGEAGPERPVLLARRAELRLALGQDAASDLDALAASPDGDLRVAEVYQRRGDYGRSIPLLEARRARDPDSLEATFRLATAYERAQRLPEAVTLFQELLTRAPNFAPALNYLGYLWIERAENLERALEMVRQAVRLDPDNGSYVDSVGWGLFKLGRVPESIGYLERAVRLLPDDATVAEHLGDAHLAAGNRERAREAYRRAAAIGGEEAKPAVEKLEKLGERP